MPTPVSLLFVHTASDDREMYAEYLSGEGFRVLQAATTDAALPLINDAEIIVTGLRVPGSIAPNELIATIRRDPRTAAKPILVLTAVAFSAEHERARRAGADTVIVKPCLPDAFAAEVRRALDERATRTHTHQPHPDRRKIPDRRAQWRGGRRDSDWQTRHRGGNPADNLLWFASTKLDH